MKMKVVAGRTLRLLFRGSIEFPIPSWTACNTHYFGVEMPAEVWMLVQDRV